MATSEGGLSVIIPAASPGRLYKSCGPRPLVDLGGRTLIDRQVSAIRGAHPGCEIVVCLGRDDDAVARRLPEGVKVARNESPGSNVAASIAAALGAATHGRVLMVHGDLLFNSRAVADVCLGWSSVLADDGGQLADTEVGLSMQDGAVSRFDFGLPRKWGQVAYLSGRELEAFGGLARAPSNAHLFAWELLNGVIDAGGRIRAVFPRDVAVIEIDSARDIARARDAIARGAIR